jgi:stress-induced-phosphoprotein 1
MAAMGKMFGPDMWTKIAANPELAPFLGQADVVTMLQDLQQNPQNMSKYFQDQRMMKIIMGLMGIGGYNGSGGGEEAASSNPAPSKAEQAKPVPTPAAAPEVPDEEKLIMEKRAKSDAAKTLGNDFYKKRKFAEALVHYDEAWAADETNVAVLTNKAAVLFEMENYEETIKTCELAVETGREIRADFKLIGRYGDVIFMIGL